MENDKLLLILISLVGFGVIIELINTLGLALLSYEVRPLINEVKAELDEFEMPDFSSVNELMKKLNPLVELADEFNNVDFKYYFKEGMNFIKRLDEIAGADLVVEGLPGWSSYYVNEVLINE